jgi:hypothetical protein
MTLLIIPSVILAELAFLLGYFLTFQICMLCDLFLSALVKRKLMTKALMAGLLCGGVGGFCALRTAFIFYRLSEATSVWFLVVSLVFPVVGLFKYCQAIFRRVSTGIADAVPILWRPHAAMMAVPQRYRFTLEKTHLEKEFPERVGLNDDPLGHAAYRVTSKYLLGVTLASFLGTAVGMCLAYGLMV